MRIHFVSRHRAMSALAASKNVIQRAIADLRSQVQILEDAFDKLALEAESIETSIDPSGRASDGYPALAEPPPVESTKTAAQNGPALQRKIRATSKQKSGEHGLLR